MNIVQKMEALADEWHCGVERKGKGHVPYIAHPRAVVAQLKAWGMTEEANPVPLAVAWGHDLVEDTRVPEILMVKLADRVCNTRDFMKDPRVRAAFP